MSSARTLVLELNAREVRAEIIPAISAVASEFPGPGALEIEVATGRRIYLPERIDSSDTVLRTALERLFHHYAVKPKRKDPPA